MENLAKLRKLLEINKEVTIHLKIITKSSTTELRELNIDDAKISGTFKVRAVPEKGKANAEIIKFLSKNLKIAKQNITIISGVSSSRKTIALKK